MEIELSKLYGVKVFYTRKTEFLDDILHIKFHMYDYSRLKQISLESNVDFIVPFPLVKDQSYYLLVAEYTKKVKNITEKQNNLMIELFDNQHYAEKAIQYLMSKKVPTTHEILNAGSKLHCFKEVDPLIHSFSVNSSGEICIIEYLPWLKKHIALERLKIIELRI